MYAEAGLNPLLGFPPDGEWTVDYKNRVRLRGGIARVGSDPKIDALARTYNARWIYLDETTYPRSPHNLNLDALRANPRITEVYRRGMVHVFQIDLP
jgi:hypothetical protein